MPLFPLSPERINTRIAASNSNNQNYPLSPSMPPSSPSKHAQSNSEVQAMVSRFNSLEINDHVELHKRDVAALKRAQMGREEAETELRSCREELRQYRKDIDEGSGREKKVMKRLDVVMEDLHRQKETQASAQTLYEREIRRARKEAFKSSSTVVKLQEDLKSARANLSVARSDLEAERARARQRDQDVFAAQYELVGVQEDLGKDRERCQVLISERDALKCQLKEEEVARVASEGMIALPTSTPQGSAPEEDDEFASPKKRRTPSHTPRAQSQEMSRQRLELDILREELVRLSQARDTAEGQVEFMKMECQFQCCSCRVAEHKGRRFIHDASFAALVQRIRPASSTVDTEEPPAYDAMVVDGPAPEPTDTKQLSHPPTPRPASPMENLEEAHQDQQQHAPKQEGEDDVFYSPNSGTFRSNTNEGSYEPRTAEQRTALRRLDSNMVTKSRPTVYINANGHAHEKEHQPHGHPRRASQATISPEATKEIHDFIGPATPTRSSEKKAHTRYANNDTAQTLANSLGPALTPNIPDENENEPDEELEVAEEDDDLLDFQESPTTHIQATTKITTIPLAPLSSPVKAMHAPTPRHQRSFSRSRSAATTPEPSFPANGAHTDEAPCTPGLTDITNANDQAQEAKNPETDNPWTPFTTSTLTREEAIERIRARRGRDRERALTATSSAPALTTNSTTQAAGAGAMAGVTPKRSASHGEGLVSARVRERKEGIDGRRDVSAPESAKRSVRR